MLVLASTPIRKRNTGAGILPQVRVRTVNLLVKYSDTLPVELPVDFLFSGKPAPASTQNESVKIYNRNELGEASDTFAKSTRSTPVKTDLSAQYGQAAIWTEVFSIQDRLAQP